MTQPQNAPNVTLAGGAAIVAPVNAFPNGVLPSNALVVIPLGPNGAPVEKRIVEGPVALQMEEVWKLLGFNGPAVQVQDDQGRPIAIGLEDLLASLEKNWTESNNDPQAGRILAQELMKYGRSAKAETVLARLVALGGDGEDWLALGIAQLNQGKLDKAEATLKGAQNLLKENPIPALQLARVAAERKDLAGERGHIESAIALQPFFVDGWAALYAAVRRTETEEAAVAAVEALAATPAHEKNAAPFIALQSFYAETDATRDRAIGFAKRAVERAPGDALALLCLTSLHGAAGKLDEIVKVLAPHEGLMTQDVRVAYNYVEALFQLRDFNRATLILNKLAASQNREVKQFAIERSRALAQLFAQQQPGATAG
jgi:tetratricopeptide (TPR) repeat protein